MSKWDEMEETIDALYPAFKEYAEKKGYLMVVDVVWIKEWYEFIMEETNGVQE